MTLEEPKLTDIQRKLLHCALADLDRARQRLHQLQLFRTQPGQPKMERAVDETSAVLLQVWHLLDGLDR